jgi:hypothetical protein
MALDFSKFKISNADLDDDFGVDKKKDNKPQEDKKDKPFNQGLYKDCVIFDAEMGEQMKNDPTWLQCNYKLRCGDRVFKIGRAFVPTCKLTYGPDQTAGSFSMLRSFLAALGVELTKENAPDVIPAVFGDPSIMNGMRVDAKFVYEGYYAHYVNKGLFHCYDAYDKPMCVDGVNPREFPSREAVENYVTDILKKEFAPWVSLKPWHISKPTTPNTKTLPTKPSAVAAPEKKKRVVSFD